MSGSRRINPFLAVSLALHILLLAGFKVSSSQEHERPLPRIINLQLETSLPTSAPRVAEIRPQPAPEPAVKTVKMPAVVSRPVHRVMPARRVYAAPGYGLRKGGTGSSSESAGYGRGRGISPAAGGGIAIPAAAGPQTGGIGIQAPVAGAGAIGLGLSSAQGRASGEAYPERPGGRGSGSSDADEGGKSGPGEVRTPEFRLPSLTRAAVASRVEPVYPPEARRRGLEGEVRVRIKVSDSGRVEDVDLLRSSGQASLDKAALEAARHWRFDPARRGSDRTPDAVNVTFRFSLQGER